MKPRKTPPAPLLWAFFFLATGIGFAMVTRFSEPSRSALFAVTLFGFCFALGALFFAYINSSKYRLPSLILLLLAIMAFGALRLGIETRIPGNDIRQLAGQNVTITGTVVSEIDVKPERQRFDFAVDSVELGDSLYSATGTVRTYYYRGRPLAYGDRLRIRTRLQKPNKATNPFAFDFERSLSRQGIGVVAFVYTDGKVEIIDTSGGNWLIREIVRPVKTHIAATIDSGLHGGSAALLKGLLLGKGRELPASVRSAFADSGTIHILAVSGLHVGLIAGLAWLILSSIFRIPRWLAAIIVILVLALYAGVVGARPSVLRASLMFSIIVTGTAFRRPYNLLNSIGAAGFILLVIKPMWLTDIGFQLSFGATIGIAYLLPLFENWIPEKIRIKNFVGKWIILPLEVSIAATLGTAPFVAYHFHRLQIIGPIANLFVIPPLALIIGYGVLASTLIVVWKPLPLIFLYADWALLRYLLNAVKVFADIPFAYLTFPHLTPWWIALYYIILWGLPTIILRLTKSRWGGLVFLIAISLVLTVVRFAAETGFREEVKITFFDIGQGDCALVEFHGGREILIDGGMPGNAVFAVEPYLRARGLKKLDAVLLTHPDADHLGGIADLYGDFDYDVVYVPFKNQGSELYDNFLARADSNELRIELLSKGDTIRGFPEFNVLWPDTTAVSRAGSLIANINEASIVTMLEYGEAEILFTGDIGFPTEKALAVLGDSIDCDVLKVPHHGSRFSSCSTFVAKTTPVMAVISVGAKNRFGHPAPEVIDRYSASGSTILRTDRVGAVIVTIEHDSIFYECNNNSQGGFSVTDQPTKTTYVHN
ncbi:DNA internalization-related competence protein ComEC/Rec2 [bacterium]|nr:MAG: DNA internalization-related competence protein ComEC/Rec2 [bacterium]